MPVRIKVYILSYPVFQACYRYNNNNIHICCLECNKPLRRLGICSYILSYIKNKAKEENIKTLTLDVSKDNLITQNCYKKNGFVITGNTFNELYLMTYHL